MDPFQQKSDIRIRELQNRHDNCLRYAKKIGDQVITPGTEFNNIINNAIDKKIFAFDITEHSTMTEKSKKLLRKFVACSQRGYDNEMTEELNNSKFLKISYDNWRGIHVHFNENGFQKKRWYHKIF